MRKSLLSLLLLVLSVGLTWAQKQVAVTGIVVAAENNEPIEGASVICVEHPRSGGPHRREGEVHPSSARGSEDPAYLL